MVDMEDVKKIRKNTLMTHRNYVDIPTCIILY